MDRPTQKGVELRVRVHDTLRRINNARGPRLGWGPLPPICPPPQPEQIKKTQGSKLSLKLRPPPISFLDTPADLSIIFSIFTITFVEHIQLFRSLI